MEVDSWSTSSKRGFDTPDNLLANLPMIFGHGLIFCIVQMITSGVINSLLLGHIFGVTLYSTLLIILFLLFAVAAVFGITNSVLAERFWNLNPRKTVPSILGQGFLLQLFFPLAYINGLVLIFWPVSGFGAVGLIVFFILIDSIILGYAGRFTAAEFEDAGKGKEDLASVSARHIPCPHCKSYFVASPYDMESDGTITCPHCGKYHTARVGGPSIDDPSDFGMSHDGW